MEKQVLSSITGRSEKQYNIYKRKFDNIKSINTFTIWCSKIKSKNLPCRLYLHRYKIPYIQNYSLQHYWFIKIFWHYKLCNIYILESPVDMSKNVPHPNKNLQCILAEIAGHITVYTHYPSYRKRYKLYMCVSCLCSKKPYWDKKFIKWFSVAGGRGRVNKNGSGRETLENTL